jgi:hypothetical protein
VQFNWTSDANNTVGGDTFYDTKSETNKTDAEDKTSMDHNNDTSAQNISDNQSSNRDQTQSHLHDIRNQINRMQTHHQNISHAIINNNLGVEDQTEQAQPNTTEQTNSDLTQDNLNTHVSQNNVTDPNQNILNPNAPELRQTNVSLPHNSVSNIGSIMN